MGWFEDACDWVAGAVEDVGEAVGDAVDAVGDAVQEAVDWVGDAVENVGEAIVATGEGMVDTLVDFGDAVGAVAGGADWDSTWADFGMNAADNLIFDPVDYLTGGAVDLDYDDGQFNADLDFGIGSVGLQVGAAGFSADASFDIGIASGSISLDSSAGFAASGSLGIAGGPLPFVEGHLSISPDGDVLIGGELQATLPFPDGYIGGSFSGELGRNDDGSWGASGSVDAGFQGPLGTGADFHLDGSASVDPADGDADFDLNLDASATGPMGAHAGVDAGVAASFDDGRFEQTVTGEVDAGVAGRDVDLGGTATVGVGAGGPSVAGDAWADLDLPDTGPGGNPAAASSTAGLDGGMGDQLDDAGGQVADLGDLDLGPVDVGFTPPVDVSVPDLPDVADAPPPPPDDFSQDIQATDQLEDAADDMWDGLGQ